MDLFRVTWVDPGWETLAADAPFHPLFVPVDLQGGGRFDNPSRYAALYASTTTAGAVGETFGNMARWLAAEVTRTVEGRPRCLVRLHMPDDLKILDLDDPVVLQKLGLRPSDVVRRDQDHTREVALGVWLRANETGHGGLRWWSYWRPVWDNVVLWSDGLTPVSFGKVTVADVEPLRTDHPAVMQAADVLPRQLD